MHFVKAILAISLISSPVFAAEITSNWTFNPSSVPQKFTIDSHQNNADLIIQMDQSGSFVVSAYVKHPEATVADLRLGEYGLHLINIQSLAHSVLFSAEIPNSELPAFIHGLTAASSGTITIDNSKPLTVSLSGSSKAVDALNSYASDNGLKLPAPFKKEMQAPAGINGYVQALSYMKKTHPNETNAVSRCARESTSTLPLPISPNDMKKAFLTCSEPREEFRMVCSETLTNTDCMGAASMTFLGYASN